MELLVHRLLNIHKTCVIILLPPLPHPSVGHAAARGAVPNPLQAARPSEKEVMSVSQCVSPQHSMPGPSSAFPCQHLLNCTFVFDLSQPFPPLPLTKQQPKCLWKCKAGTSAAVIAVRVCVLGGGLGEKVVIGVSHKISSSQLYRDLLDWGVH